MLPYLILGCYEPPFWKAWKVGEDLTSLVKGLGYKPLKDPAHGPLDVSWSSVKLHAEVRRTTSYGKGGDEWHQDGDTTPNAKMDYTMILWASSTPSLLKRVGDNVVYQPQPFEIIAFSNIKMMHRRPDNAPAKRYLFRQRVDNR